MRFYFYSKKSCQNYLLVKLSIVILQCITQQWALQEQIFSTNSRMI